MKKLIIIIFTLICSTVLSYSQVRIPNVSSLTFNNSKKSDEKPTHYNFRDNFKYENNSVSFGLHFGAVGQLQDLGLQIFMGHLSFKGIYLDFGGWPQSHGSDVRVGTWDADRAWLIHAGYIIPLNSFLRITPLIGYAKNETGITNGYHWTVTPGGIHNDFESEWSCGGFDFGGQLTININHLNIYGTFTKFAWYAGLGYEIHL